MFVHTLLVYGKKIPYLLVALMLFLCALATFYRNRDPYKAYFHRRDELYLSALLSEYLEKPRGCPEYRLRDISPTPFYAAIRQLYQHKRLVLTGEGLLDDQQLALATGVDVEVEGGQVPVPAEQDIPLLLAQAHYSFLYSPLAFSPLRATLRQGTCLMPSPALQAGSYPLMMILLPAQGAATIRVVHAQRYLVFLPVR